ncbi:MAG: response regulator [Proteobacteria bacterium]|nr:response regulator [Pseudomonadota bacterium]
MSAAGTTQDDNKPCILVVDDSRVVRVSVSRALDGAFQVLQAEDGEIGINRAKALKPDLVISDINMPNLDGYGFICRLRAEDEDSLADVPIIVITSAEEDTVRERAYACGANAFILKPFNPGQLMDSVLEHIANHDASSADLKSLYGDSIESVIASDVVIQDEA